ncbi:SprT-like domain-containing protein [Natronobiforma cellulositropha]|uniref:SprT-like domain-containing protein n=1 Tax=Natronobiforma cellulositropha TaxID=1679076 RepID=UPI0021D583F3|nr:SprT-like domain-containing protein [Natronobiforma cellulositropha]
MSDPTDEQILAHARVHARAVIRDERNGLAVEFDALEWAVSRRAKRRAGSCRWDADREVATIVLSRRAYCAFEPSAFEAVVRHELIHAWEFQRFGEAGHGERFLERAAELDVPRHCASFTPPRYTLSCLECGWSAERHRASKPVRAPDRYRCGVCGGGYEVEHVESGRTWRSASGYGGAKAALGAEW